MRKRHVAVDVLEAASVRDTLGGLRSSACAASGERVDNAEHLVRPGLSHGREQLASTLANDRNLDARIDVARIQALLEVEHAGRGRRIAFANRPLDRSSSTPPRQIREMKVYPPVGRHRQYVRGDEAAVGDNDAEVSMGVLDALRDVGGLQRRCLQQVDACLGGHLCHR